VVRYVWLLSFGCSIAMSTKPMGLPRCEPDHVGPRIDASVVAAAVLIDVIMFVRATSCTGSCGRDFAGPGAEAIVVSLASLPVIVPYGASALYGASLDVCPSEPERAHAATADRDSEQAQADREQAERQRDQAERDRAWAARTTTDPSIEALMRTAVNRARANDCSTVRTIGTRVRELDGEYYTRVFAHEPAIRACFEP
jgi:hypothetical protein